tara:strand:- start:11196 stop:11396 length:201 start_codon:yes stop_codon:yes gene_type:complete
MSGWEGEAEITGAEVAATSGKSAETYLQLIRDRGVPIDPDYLVEMEMRKDEKGTVYYYRWMRKDGL